MPPFIADSSGQPTLRQQAHHQLVAGVAPQSRGWGVSVEALTLLHRLASQPGSASDALKLLHELQVHQVELDLQQAQLEANERELNDELSRYRLLFEQAPSAQFLMDAGDHIVECNRAGAILLNAGDVVGRRFDEFLSPDSRLPLAALLRDARAGANAACRTVQPVSASPNSRPWQVAAGALFASGEIQLAVTDGAALPDG